jgi:large subunit ribosomal protein L22
MEARAISKYVRMSPTKVRRVVDMVRGKEVDDAINILHFTRKAASVPVEKTLRSAVANLVNNTEASRVDPEDLFVKEIRVDDGVSLKRFRAASMGRAMRLHRRTCHITVVVAQKE